MEKDTIHYLSFIPADGRAVNRTSSLDDPRCVLFSGNPKGNAQMIEDAIRAFEAKHQVESWQEKAVRYEVNSLYYP